MAKRELVVRNLLKLFLSFLYSLRCVSGGGLPEGREEHGQQCPVSHNSKIAQACLREGCVKVAPNDPCHPDKLPHRPE